MLKSGRTSGGSRCSSATPHPAKHTNTNAQRQNLGEFLLSDRQAELLPAPAVWVTQHPGPLSSLLLVGPSVNLVLTLLKVREKKTSVSMWKPRTEPCRPDILLGAVPGLSREGVPAVPRPPGFSLLGASCGKALDPVLGSGPCSWPVKALTLQT